MLEQVRELPAADLDAQEYLDDFWRHSEQIDDLWKLERIQSFQEPDEPSWVSMMNGDWDRALALIEEKRAASKHHVSVADGIDNRRVRVTELPVTPYLQWEMHVLRIWAETGAQDIRVIDQSGVGALEADGPLPEVVILGSSVMYETLYDATGTHSGGRRIDDPDVIAACRNDLAGLYNTAEDMFSYFEREIAPLPPPDVGP
ncbi:DUF6879 family protein [Actinomadura xylanilytica]|uniref:DUF6879 family protein n=1 Tax=Actinomadura xylanilytica TaxID=887459 RepID=UPI00255ADE54|nr:DUF6879 family protein [Actinomadura xylanilytica]MDL4774521.1 hypothetical protein [Actinomadura xylanilytica]